MMDINTSKECVSFTHHSIDNVSLVANATTTNRYTMWHNRLNHIGHDTLKRLKDTGLYSDMTWDEDEYIAHRSKVCHGCASGIGIQCTDIVCKFYGAQ